MAGSGQQPGHRELLGGQRHTQAGKAAASPQS